MLRSWINKSRAELEHSRPEKRTHATPCTCACSADLNLIGYPHASAQLSLRALMCRRARRSWSLGFSCFSSTTPTLPSYLRTDCSNHIEDHHLSSWSLPLSWASSCVIHLHLHWILLFCLRRQAKGGSNGDTQTSGRRVPRGGRAGCRAAGRRRLVQGHRHVLRRRRRLGHNGYVPTTVYPTHALVTIMLHTYE